MGWRRFAIPTLMGAAVLFASAAAADLDRPINGAPGDAEAYLKRGYAELETGEVDRAVSDFDQTIQLRPDLALAYFYRGIAHFALNADGAAALADLQAAQRLKPDWTAVDAVTGYVKMLTVERVMPLDITPPPGDAPSKAVGRTHDCAAYFFIFSALMAKTGGVLIHYGVTDTGAITAVGVQTSSGDEWMDRAAVLCVSRHWRNTPAFRGGVAVASPQHTALLQFVTR